MSKRSRSSAMALAALVVLAAVVVTAATASSNNHAVKLHSSPAPAVSARLAQLFKVLSATNLGARGVAARTGAQPLPASVVQGMSNYEPDLAPAEAVFTGGVYPTWVVPGSSEVCLVVGTTGSRSVPGATCGPTAKAEAGLTGMTETDSGQPVVLGLAPNGNTSVEVTNADGTTENVPVTNNVYEVVSGKPSTVSLKTASGTPTTESVAIGPPPAASAPSGSEVP
jgi:hypothetical protein